MCPEAWGLLPELPERVGISSNPQPCPGARPELELNPE